MKKAYCSRPAQIHIVGVYHLFIHCSTSIQCPNEQLHFLVFNANECRFYDQFLLGLRYKSHISLSSFLFIPSIVLSLLVHRSFLTS